MPEVEPYVGTCPHLRVKAIARPQWFTDICLDCRAVRSCDG